MFGNRWLTLVAAAAGALLLSAPASAGPHDPGYYSCNADNGVTYYRYVKKRSDAEETAFKKAVTAVTGIGKGCRSVAYPAKEPSKGQAI